MKAIPSAACLLILATLALAGFCPQSPANFRGRSSEASQGPARPKEMVQFSSAGHVLGFAQDSVYVASGSHALRVEFVNASRVGPSPLNNEGATASASAPSGAVAKAASPLSQVTYANLWDGITLRYDAPEGGIARTTWRIEPGASVEKIRLRYNAPVSIEKDGSLRIGFATGTLNESAPVAWQERDGHRVAVEVTFSQHAKDEIGFALGPHDWGVAVFIDPTLTWNTFLGGSSNDIAYGVAVDGSGNVYVAGYSDASWGSPVRAFSGNGNSDAFAARLDSSGNLIWNTFLGGNSNDIGGSSNDVAYGVVVDGSGNVYVAGVSNGSWGSPVRAFGGYYDGFAAKLNSSGNLIWNTFLGGSDYDRANGVAVDGSGNVYVAGYSSLATWGSPVRAFSGNSDAFAAKLDSSGTLIWNTFLGDNSYDGADGVAVDGSGNVYVVGTSYASWGSPVRAFSGGFGDAFAAKLDSSGKLIWNTFLGGSSDDEAHGVAVDGSGNVYVAGASFASWGSPVGAFSGNRDDAFTARLDSSGNLIWNTFLGGSSADLAYGLAADGSGNVYVAGTSSASWGSPVRAFSGDVDAFAARLDSSGNRIWNTFLGGSSTDGANGVAIDASGNVYVAGISFASWGSPVRAFSGGNYDAFAAKILDSSADTDGDSLPDSWETRGVTIDASGNATPGETGNGDFIDLPKMGAKPKHKDIFVHADWMPAFGGLKFKPDPHAIAIVVKAFEQAPVDDPDGTQGVHLHVDLGEDSIMNVPTNPTQTWGGLSKARQLPYRQTVNFDLADNSDGGFGWFKQQQSLFVGARRYKVFHYALFCKSYSLNGNLKASSGVAFTPGVDLLISLPWTSPNDRERGIRGQAGTFMHELGHNLGLDHGGFFDGTNNKPNYLSVMNYNFQFEGLIPANGERVTDYSVIPLPTLDEDNLDESVGIDDPEGHSTLWVAKRKDDYYRWFPSPQLDWNLSGAIEDDALVAADINSDEVCVSAGPDGILNTIPNPSSDDVVKGQKLIAGPNRVCDTEADTHDKQEEAVGFYQPRFLIAVADWPLLTYSGGGQIGQAGASVPSQRNVNVSSAIPDQERPIDEIVASVPQELLDEQAAAPIEEVFVSPQIGQPPLSVTFDGSASTSVDGTIVDWAWDFGDGSTGSGSSVAHIYSTPGIYFAKLKVTDSSNRKNLEPLLHRVTVAPNLQFTGAVSRMIHGRAGTFDVPLPVGNQVGVECRNSGGNYTVVFSFTNNVTSGFAAITQGVGVVAGDPLFRTNTATVQLTGVSNAQTLTISFKNVMDEFEQFLPTAAVSMGLLLGDVNSSRRTDSGDVTVVRNHTVSIPDQQSFRFDVNASGRIDAGDVTVTRNASVTVLPP